MWQRVQYSFGERDVRSGTIGFIEYETLLRNRRVLSVERHFK